MGFEVGFMEMTIWAKTNAVIRICVEKKSFGLNLNISELITHFFGWDCMADCMSYFYLYYRHDIIDGREIRIHFK